MCKLYYIVEDNLNNYKTKTTKKEQKLTLELLIRALLQFESLLLFCLSFFRKNRQTVAFLISTLFSFWKKEKTNLPQPDNHKSETMFKLVIMSVVLALLCARASPQQVCYYFNGIDFYGNDLPTGPFRVASFGDCCAACAANAQCGAWTYTETYCYLKYKRGLNSFLASNR